MTTNNELLPCPFCGYKRVFVQPDEVGSGGQWVAPIHVGCERCKAEQLGDTETEAAANWNRRAALQSQPKADPSEWMKQHEALMHRVSKAAMVLGYGGTINGATAEQALENAEIALLDHARALQSQDREDTERMDWLQQHDGCFYNLLRITSIVNKGFSPTNNLGKRWFSSIREAIDHARRIEGENHGSV